jgi:hypothetical protein
MNKKVVIELNLDTEKGNDYLYWMLENRIKTTFDSGTQVRNLDVKIYNL